MHCVALGGTNIERDYIEEAVPNNLFSKCPCTVLDSLLQLLHFKLWGFFNSKNEYNFKINEESIHVYMKFDCS